MSDEEKKMSQMNPDSENSDNNSEENGFVSDSASLEEELRAQVDAFAAEISADQEKTELPDWAKEASQANNEDLLAGFDAQAEESETVEEEEEIDELPSLPAEDENDDGRAWYVVHCYSGYENKVRHNLEQRIDSMGMKGFIFDIVVPTEEEIEVKDGKRRSIERRVFPGYILVNMIMTDESWFVVRNTPGVTSFVGMGNEPTPLRPEEVNAIIKRMEADAPRIKVSFRKGERVRITDGPFNEFRGTVEDIDMERAKVRVMVNFFGRDTPVELDFLQVEKT